MRSSRSGQSLIEILIALAVGTLMIGSAISVIAPALRGNTQATRAQIGTALGKELLENTRVWAETDWHNIYNLNKTSANKYYLIASSTPFAVVSGIEEVIMGTSTYQRYFYIDNVNRDGGGNITTGAGTDDPSTQKITVVYTWPTESSSSFSMYVTRSRSIIWKQTDWSGGPGQVNPVGNPDSRFDSSTNIDFATTTGSIRIRGI